MDNIRLSLLENNFIFYLSEMIRVNTARHISYKPKEFLNVWSFEEDIS